MKEIVTELNFNKKEEAVFLGHLLGDGHIQKRGLHSYRTKIEHCYDQLSYVKWKYDQLKRFTYKQPKKVRSKHGFESSLFYLKSGTYLKKYHDLFYEPYIWVSKTEPKINKTKIRYCKKISEQLIHALPNDPLLLAVWFMDDGNRRSDCFSGRFATQGFSKEEHHLLQEYLYSNFSIKTSIVLHNAIKKSYSLVIPSKKNNFLHFIDLIQPIVEQVPCMAHKIKSPRND